MCLLPPHIQVGPAGGPRAPPPLAVLGPPFTRRAPQVPRAPCSVRRTAPLSQASGTAQRMCPSKGGGRLPSSVEAGGVGFSNWRCARDRPHVCGPPPLASSWCARGKSQPVVTKGLCYSSCVFMSGWRVTGAERLWEYWPWGLFPGGAFTKGGNTNFWSAHTPTSSLAFSLFTLSKTAIHLASS